MELKHSQVKMSNKLTVAQVNELNCEEFIDFFANIVEKTPEACEKVFQERPYKNREDLCDKFTNFIKKLPQDERLKLLRQHPVLSGKEAEKKELTMESEQEQKGAKLDRLDKQTKERIDRLNSEYIEKFNFPFIVCVAEHTVNSILNEMEKRLSNDQNAEIIKGVNEVIKICQLRVLKLIEE